MLKSFISDRIIFSPIENQGIFLVRSKEKLNITWIDFGKMLGFNTRTVRDWARNKKRMPFAQAIIISRKSGISLGTKIKRFKWNEHASIAGKTGGLNNLLINGHIGGNKKYRNEKWKIWWETKGRFIENSITKAKKVILPNKSVELAEFVGIMIGDGGICEYHASIFLNSVADKEYSKYVCSLIKKLFGVVPKKYFRKDALCVEIVIQRKNVIDFCQQIGLKMGNKLKQGLDIPSWIKGNREYEIACIRGLVDTDGCFFKHKYKVQKKEYTYNKIAFTSKSPALIQSVMKTLINFGINARISKDRCDVRIETKKDVLAYLKIVGTHNSKHILKTN